MSASATTSSLRPEIWLALRSPRERVALAQPFALHEQTLRALDRLARRERCGERVRLGTERHELLVPRLGHLDRRQEVGLAKGLHEVAEDARLDSPRDELLLAVGRHHHDRHRPLLEDPPGGVDAVELRHLHVEQREIGGLGERQLDRLLAVSRLRNDLEAAPFEQLAQVEPDDGLVFRDQDSHVCLSSGRESHVRMKARLARELERPAELVADERTDDREPGPI